MPDLAAMPLFDAWVTLGVLAAMFGLFVRELYPPEVVALGAAALLLLLGVVTPDDVLVAFANPAPWTIAAMFILSGTLTRTGALALVTGRVTGGLRRHPRRTAVAFGLFVIIASAFVNNTPIVVMLIPVVLALAQDQGLSPSKFLIPLSYLTILGGMCTLIGTSTNLLVDGVAQARGLEPFTLFEVTPLALPVAVAGLIYLRFAAPRLLPDRDTVTQLLHSREKMKFFTEVAVPEGSPLIGTRVFDVGLFKREGIRVIDVLRGDESLRRQFPDVTLGQGDRVVLRTDVGELLGLKESGSVHMVDALGSRSTTTVEALITPGCQLIGRSLGRLRLRRRYGVYPLAVHRRNQNIASKLDDVVIEIGDTLLLEGAPEDIQRLAQDVDLVDMAQPTARSYRRSHAPLALLALGAVVALAALGVAAIFPLAIFAVAFVLLTRCIDADEAFEAIDGRLLALIFSMLVVGRAMERSGAVDLIVGPVSPFLADLPPSLLVFAIFALASTLTEIVSNNAVAVVVAPVAITLADSLGVDPRPLVVAVMMAASCSFATPIGYQTNTLVYGPGGYRFTDFLRIGVPLNLSIAVLSSLLIPLIWPLT